MLDPALKLRHLTTFVEVASAGSIVKAAQNLRISQPAVSKTLRELESLLGVELLDRSRRQVALTRSGEIFLGHAQAGLLLLREGAQTLRDAKSPAARPLRIGALPTVSVRLMPLAVRRFMSAGLGAVPRVVTGPNAFLMGELAAGELDIVIGRMVEPSEMGDFAFEQLYSEELCFAVRPRHPLLSRSVFRAADIVAYEILMPPPGSVIRAAVERLFLATSIPRPAQMIETVSLAFGRGYLRESDAIWVISEGVVTQDIADGVLARLPVDTSQSLGAVGITRRAKGPFNAAAEIFIRELRASADELQADRAARSRSEGGRRMVS